MELKEQIEEHVIAIRECKNYLAETDWTVVRASEPEGTPIPEDVLAARIEAREKINVLEEELKELYKEYEKDPEEEQMRLREDILL